MAAFGALAACLGGTVVGGMEEGVAEIVVIISATGIGVPGLISFIAFNMLTIPCFAAVAAAKGELGKGKFRWTLLFWIVVSFLVSTIVYTVGEWAWTVAVWLILGGLVALGIAAYNKRTDRKNKTK